MISPTRFKALQKYSQVKNPAKSSLNSGFPRQITQENAGFSIVEVLVVLVMIGILAAIALPGWLAFVNRQRVNKANDAVLAAVQEAQRQAKATKFRYSVSFRNDATEGAQVALHSDAITPSAWQALGGNVGLKPKEIWVGSNLTSTNRGSNIVSAITTTATDIKTITFDYNGSLPVNATEPLKIVVAIPQSGNATQSLANTRRCVIVETLIGGIRTSNKNNDCS